MEYYDKISKSYNELHGGEQRKKMKIVNRLLSLKLGDKRKILDVGCGTGLSTPEGATGVDPSLKLLKQHPGMKKGKCIYGDAENLPFKDNSFDIVISITAIHNFKDYEKGLQEMKRVGRGEFVFSVLKKANNFDKIVAKIEEMFTIKQRIEEEKDIIFYCSN